MAVIRVAGVRKRFGGIVVAEDISLEIAPGEILGLIGPNGAGKTTLFNLISGIHAPDGGEIWLRDRPLSGLSVVRRARLGIARTWQHIRLFPTLTVLENLLMGPRHYPGEALFGGLFQPGARRALAAQSRARAESILARIGMPDASHKLPGELPFGQQKLVGLARTLMNDGEVLLLDEPMAGVPAGESAEILDTLGALPGDVAVLLIEHDMDLVFRFATRITVLVDGAVLVEGTRDAVARDPAVKAAYLGEAAHG